VTSWNTYLEGGKEAEEQVGLENVFIPGSAWAKGIWII